MEKAKYHPTTVMLETENWKALKIQAAQKETTLSSLINDIIAREMMR